MKTYILIGGIGSGKSTVLRMLSEHGAETIDLDHIGHDCLADEDIIAALTEAFGTHILDGNGTVKRRALAEAAYGSAHTTEVLNAIMHPAITAAAQLRLDDLSRQGCACVIVEVSAYQGPGTSLAGLAEGAHGIIAVVAPEDVRSKRAVANGFNEDDVRNRMQRQPSDDMRRVWADHVIVNDGTYEHLQAQVDALWTVIAPDGREEGDN